MIFEKSEIIIEVILMIVLVVGIIRCQQIVKGLKAAKDSCKTIDDLGANLDSSVEQATAVFDNIRHQITTAEKKVSVLVDHAANIEEDLEDREKAAKEADAALSLIMERMETREQELSSMLEKAGNVIEQLREQLERGTDIAQELETQRAKLTPPKSDDVASPVTASFSKPQTLGDDILPVEAHSPMAEEAKEQPASPQPHPEYNEKLSTSDNATSTKPLRPYLRRQNKAP